MWVWACRTAATCTACAGRQQLSTSQAGMRSTSSTTGAMATRYMAISVSTRTDLKHQPRSTCLTSKKKKKGICKKSHTAKQEEKRCAIVRYNLGIQILNMSLLVKRRVMTAHRRWEMRHYYPNSRYCRRLTYIYLCIHKKCRRCPLILS